MSEECAGSLQVCAMRVARLGPDGVPLPGAGNLYVTDALIQLAVTTEISAGDDFEQKNGCGAICVNFKDCDRIKRLNLTMQICTPDPELVELLVGGVLLQDGGETVGYGFPRTGQQTCPDGASIEAFTKAIVDGALAPTRSYWRWVLPRTFWQLGDRTLENGVSITNLVGFANENPNWFDGPANDWPFDSDRVMQYARDDTLPTTSCGAQVLVAS